MSPVQRLPVCSAQPRSGHWFKPSWIALAAALLLVGCASHSNYQRPALELPGNWQQDRTNAPQPAAAAHSNPWWQRFNDPQLNQLIDSALQRNSDLASAALNIQQAQLKAGLEGDPLSFGPQGGLNAEGSRRLDNGQTSNTRSSNASLQVSYTVDLWGRLARQRDIAQWALQASEADRETVRLNVIGTTADLYWQLAYLNQRIHSAEQSLQTALRTQQLVLAQYAAGAVSALERHEAEQTVLSQRNTLSQLRQTQVETRNALALVFDAAPGSASLAQLLGPEPQLLPDGELPAVDQGLPAELLGRRPDLRAAELVLRQSLANVDVVRSSYYPTLSLTGAVGTSSSSLGNLLANPIGTLGAGLTLPFLDLEAMQLNTAIAQSEYESAVITFRQTLYQAFSDTENALSARSQLAEQADYLRQNLVAAQQAERLYEIRYRAGGATLRNWLDAQEARRSAELSLAQVQLSRLQNQVTLFQAMGGDTVRPAEPAGS
jgi:NodT family efflux transporter outer membrane factor (OMF) lipoprotein